MDEKPGRGIHTRVITTMVYFQVASSIPSVIAVAHFLVPSLFHNRPSAASILYEVAYSMFTTLKHKCCCATSLLLECEPLNFSHPSRKNHNYTLPPVTLNHIKKKNMLYSSTSLMSQDVDPLPPYNEGFCDGEKTKLKSHRSSAEPLIHPAMQHKETLPKS